MLNGAYGELHPIDPYKSERVTYAPTRPMDFSWHKAKASTFNGYAGFIESVTRAASIDSYPYANTYDELYNAAMAHGAAGEEYMISGQRDADAWLSGE